MKVPETDQLHSRDDVKTAEPKQDAEPSLLTNEETEPSAEVRARLSAAFATHAKREQAELPTGLDFGERPDGYPESMPWPPGTGDEAPGLRAEYAAFWVYHFMLTEAERKEHGLWGVSFDLMRYLPEEVAAEADKRMGWVAPEPDPEPTDAERDMAERLAEVDRAAATANGMPYSSGFASNKELLRRLEQTRAYQLLRKSLEERVERQHLQTVYALPVAERAAFDLEMAKLAARETRYFYHLFDFVDRFSLVYPYFNPSTVKERPGIGDKSPWSPKRCGYVTDTVMAALAAVKARYTVESPVVTLSSLDPDTLEPPEVIVPRLAWAGRDTLFPGREKSLGGKSTLWTAAAAAVTTGGPFLDGHAKPGRVLWVSADMEPESDLYHRFHRFGGNAEKFIFYYPSGSIEERIEKLVALVAQFDPVLLIVDTLAHFAMVEEPSQATEWVQIIGGLRERLRPFATARVFLHHVAKGTGESRDSTAIPGAVDMVLTYRNPVEGGNRREVRGGGRVVGWTPFDVVLDGTGFSILEPSAASTVQVQGPPLSKGARKAFDAVPASGGISYKDWENATGLAHTTFVRVRKVLVEERKLVRQNPETGLYEVAVFTASQEQLRPCPS